MVGVEHSQDFAQTVGDAASAFDLAGPLFDPAFEHLFGLFAAGDVGDRAEHDQPVFAAEIAQAHFDWELAAIVTASGQIQPGAHRAGVGVVDEERTIDAVVWVVAIGEQPFDRLADQIGEIIAKEIGKFLIGVQDRPGSVDGDHSDGGSFEHLPEQAGQLFVGWVRFQSRVDALHRESIAQNSRDKRKNGRGSGVSGLPVQQQLPGPAQDRVGLPAQRCGGFDLLECW